MVDNGEKAWYNGVTKAKEALKLKNKNPMYIDTENGAKQIGFVITAKADFQDSDSYKWSAQYIDLWVNIDIIQSAFEE